MTLPKIAVISDKIGFSSIATTVGIKTAEHTQIIEKTIEWSATDYALMISMIGGVLFIIEKLLAIKGLLKKNSEKKKK